MSYEFFQEGGVVMWLLLGCSIAGIALIIERSIFWVIEYRRVDPDSLEEFFDSIHRDQFRQAREFARAHQGGLIERLERAWKKRGRVRAVVKTYDLAINRIEKRTLRYLFALKTIVSVSPLLGILGTVIGIIRSFEVLGMAGTAAEPQAVGGGLAQALVTTAFGLMIAVPCLIAHNYFLAKARGYINRLDGYADELAYHVGDDPGIVPGRNRNSDERDRCGEEARE